jgi:2'-5' RNA ligase superfamily
MPDAPPDPLVLTLALEPAAQSWLQSLRDAHFPPGRNLVPAHVTLFHHLPGGEIEAIAATLAAACGATPAPAVRLGPPRFLGRGVALAVAAPGLAALRARLAAGWAAWLTPQDRQGWRAHATVQNKVPAEQARALHAALAATLPVREARAEALLLWHYRGGPWEAAGRFAFAAAAAGAVPPG